MRESRTLALISLAGAALLWGVPQSGAQVPVIGPVPSTTPGAPNYTIPNYANSPLPQLSGALTGIQVKDPGCGYSAPPTVIIDPPLDPNGVLIVGGVQATATAALGANGALVVLLATPGSGYITAPNVAIFNTNATGAVTCNCAASNRRDGHHSGHRPEEIHGLAAGLEYDQ